MFSLYNGKLVAYSAMKRARIGKIVSFTNRKVIIEDIVSHSSSEWNWDTILLLVSVCNNENYYSSQSCINSETLNTEYQINDDVLALVTGTSYTYHRAKLTSIIDKTDGDGNFMFIVWT